MTDVLDSDGRPLCQGDLVRMGSQLARVVSLPSLVEAEVGDLDGPCGEVAVYSGGPLVRLPVFAREGYAYCPDLRTEEAVNG